MFEHEENPRPTKKGIPGSTARGSGTPNKRVKKKRKITSTRRLGSREDKKKNPKQNGLESTVQGKGATSMDRHDEDRAKRQRQTQRGVSLKNIKGSDVLLHRGEGCRGLGVLSTK